MLPRRRPVDRLPLHDRDGRRRNRLERHDVTDGAGVDGPRGDAAVVGGSRILHDHDPAARFHRLHAVGRVDPAAGGTTAIVRSANARAAVSNKGVRRREEARTLVPSTYLKRPPGPTVRCRSGRAVDDAGLDEFPLRGRLHSHFRRRRDVAEDAPPRRTGMLHDHGWRPACPQGVRQAGFAAQTLHQPTPRRPPTRDDRLSTS